MSLWTAGKAQAPTDQGMSPSEKVRHGRIAAIEGDLMMVRKSLEVLAYTFERGSKERACFIAQGRRMAAELRKFRAKAKAVNGATKNKSD